MNKANMLNPSTNVTNMVLYVYKLWLILKLLFFRYRGRMINYNEFKFNDTRIELIDVGCFYQTKLDNLFVLPYYLLYEQLVSHIPNY